MARHGTNSGYKKGCRCSQCRSAHAEWQKDYMTRRALRRIQALGIEWKCAWCGATDTELAFDHRDPSNKTNEFSQILRTGTDEQVRTEFARGVQLLCRWTCHPAKKSLYRYEGRIVALPDGGYRKRSHPVRTGGTWLGWTCDDGDEVAIALEMAARIEADNERLKRLTAAVAA